LALIDAEQDKHETFHSVMLSALEAVYIDHQIYHDVIDSMAAAIRDQIGLDQVDYISGGQRRDWFFAPLIGKRLGKPVLYIYNDMSMYDEAGKSVEKLDGARVVNTADLLTVGSSYTKKWIPALMQRGARMIASVNGVDRLQGGMDNLKTAGVETVISLFSVQLSLFDQALSRGYIDQGQYDLVKSYLSDPFASMRSFLVAHPEFLATAQQADEKTKARVEKLISEDLYKLKDR